jgi:hypothetical protein
MEVCAGAPKLEKIIVSRRRVFVRQRNRGQTLKGKNGSDPWAGVGAAMLEGKRAVGAVH